MKLKSLIFIAAMAAFSALPVYAQHGHSGGASGMSHADTHSSNANSNSGSKSNESSVSDRLSDNTKLASKLQGLLPAGTDLQTAAQGFKNLGQFVAAVHVSHNLGIPFDQLKAKMIGPPSESLGKAISQLKPTVNSKTEADKATAEANQDLNDSKS